jgi:nucleoid-associated protein EbfC
VFPGGGEPDQPGQTGLDLPGLGDSGLAGLLAQAQQMQQQLLAAQQELARTEVTGTAGGGLVTATITGDGDLTGLVIDPTAIDPGDPEGLADLVIAAVRDARVAAAELQAQAMGPLAGVLGGGGLNLPGM